MRTTPVSPLTVDGRKHLIAVFKGADWVGNARAAGWGLSPGTENESGVPVQLSVEERDSALRELLYEVLQAARFLPQRYRVSNVPEAFAAHHVPS